MTDRTEKIQQKLKYIIVLDIILIITGIILLSLNLSTCHQKIPNAIEIDYTNCFDRNKNETKRQTCIQTLSEPNADSCSCIVSFDVNKSIDGDIIVYYELDYDLLNLTKDSRDVHQLNGMLSDKLDLSCAPYDYANTTEGLKPIAPCGAMADAMFNDTYTLSCQAYADYSAKTIQDIISPEDKVFHNPKLSDDMTLQQAFQNFTKPINWVKNIWQLNGNSTQNNGFEYEPFIAWMNKDWIQKPVWRLDNSKSDHENGLVAGNCGLIIFYNYPLSRYNGTRKVILGNRRIVTPIQTNTAIAFGAILLVVGLLVLLAAAYLLYVKTKQGKVLERPSPESSPINRRL